MNMFMMYNYIYVLFIIFKFVLVLLIIICIMSFKECIFGELKILFNDNNIFMIVSIVVRDVMVDSMFIYFMLCDV